MTQSNKRVAAYIRVASPDQMYYQESLQRVAIENRVKELHLEEPRFFVDLAYSGLNDNRPAFQTLTQEIKSGKVDILLVRDEGRLFRDWILLVDWLDMALWNDVEVIFSGYRLKEDKSLMSFIMSRRITKGLRRAQK